MFHNQILELQSQIHYHQQQIEETENELYQLKAFQSYGDEAYNAAAEAISHIDGKYLDAFKEAILSLFDNPTRAIRATTTQEEEEKEYVEYISDTVCYDPEVEILHIGFKDRELGEEWAQQLHYVENYGQGYLIEEAEHLPDYPLELKIKGVTIEDARTLDRIYDFTNPPTDEDNDNDDWTEEQKEKLDFQESLIRIAPDIFYQPKNNVCYMGFSNKERANNYGALLKEVHEFTTDYCVANPYVVTNCKYELRFMCSKDNAIRLAPLNLKKELAHPSNQTIVSQWVSKELPTVEDKSYPPISIDEIQPGDIVARASKGRAHFKVTCTREEGDGEVYALCECLVNPIFKTAVGQKFSLKELFLVERGAPALPPSGEAALSSCEAEDADVF